MQEIVFHKYCTPLDATVSIIKAFDTSKKVIVRVPFKKNTYMPGLVFDTTYLIKRFNVFLKSDFYFNGSEFKIFDPEHYDKYLQVFFDDKIKYQGMENGRLFEKCLIISKETNKKISVSSAPKRADKNKEPIGVSLLERILIKEKILTEEKNKTKLFFAYSGPFSFYFSPRYQDLHNNPVSFSKEHFLDYACWQVFALPIYWQNRRIILGFSYDILVGKRTLESVVDEKYHLRDGVDKNKRDKIIFHRNLLARELAQGKKRVYILVQALLDGKEWDFVCKKPYRWCTLRYHRLYFADISKALNHLRRLNSRELDILIDNYNRKHAAPLGIPYISKENFRIAFEREEKRKEPIKRKKALVVIEKKPTSLVPTHYFIKNKIGKN